MSNPIVNPQPNYSGVTIQISNPAVNVGQQGCGIIPPNIGVTNGVYTTNPNSYYGTNGYIQYKSQNNNKIISDNKNTYNSAYNSTHKQSDIYLANNNNNPVPRKVDSQVLNNFEDNKAVRDFENLSNETNSARNIYSDNRGYANSYPADYYLNNYNTHEANSDNNLKNQNYIPNQQEKDYNTETKINDYYDDSTSSRLNLEKHNYNNESQEYINNGVAQNYNPSAYRTYADNNKPKEQDFTKSNEIIGELDERNAQMQEEKKNTKETKIVALTDAYIKSLENYLNNPNDDIRLMASKEILTRLDEDKDRYDDAALNALLNKMLQDPAKLIRIAALSAFASGLACGNDYTVQLLQRIQSNPDADKEDVLQAADILLKMSAGTEVKNVPLKNKNNVQK